MSLASIPGLQEAVEEARMSPDLLCSCDWSCYHMYFSPYFLSDSELSKLNSNRFCIRLGISHGL